MFFIPLGTDAPIYHWPYATVGVIVLTILAYVAQVSVLVEERAPISLDLPFGAEEFTDEELGEEEFEGDSTGNGPGVMALESWMLATGDGIRPLQWLTHLFLHGDPLHLIGNMVFLWCFGLIVEGKVGPFWFLGLYLGSGVLEGAAIQFALLGAEPSFLLGASGAVFALLGIALIWAPSNEFNVFYFFLIGFRIFTGVKEIAVVWFAVLYFLMNLAGFVFSLLMNEGLALSSELAHLAGGLTGLAAGTVMFKTNLVDCEGWDAFTRFGKHAEHKRALWTGGAPTTARSRVRGKPKSRREADPGLTDDQRGEDASRRIRGMLDQGMVDAALKVYQKAISGLPGWKLDEPDLLRLIKGLHEQKSWADSIPVLRDAIRCYPSRSSRVKLRLAQVLIRELQRPTAGKRILDDMAGEPLPDDLAAVRRRLLSMADQMLDEGVLELEGDD